MPPLPLPGRKVGVIVSPVDRARPPPPPTLCARIPTAFTPVVVIGPKVVTVTAPPIDDAWLVFPEPSVADDVAVPTPPPPPTLCASRPIAAAPDVVTDEPEYV